MSNAAWPRERVEEPYTVTVSEATYLTGLSQAHLYNAMNRGELLFLKVGLTRRIDREALREYVRRLCIKSKPTP